MHAWNRGPESRPCHNRLSNSLKLQIASRVRSNNKKMAAPVCLRSYKDQNSSVLFSIIRKKKKRQGEISAGHAGLMAIRTQPQLIHCVHA